MRIIGGTKRGLRLRSVPGTGTRPTSDRVKEALFNILGTRCQDAVVLDLFAGSGALGLEALSRGARRAVFVEQHRRAAAVLRENLSRARLADRARVVTADVFRALDRPEILRGPFDLIFADPPYGEGLASRLPSRLGAAGLLAPEGLLVVEHDRREELPRVYENIEKLRAARYGDTMLTFFEGGP